MATQFHLSLILLLNYVVFPDSQFLCCSHSLFIQRRGVRLTVVAVICKYAWLVLNGYLSLQQLVSSPEATDPQPSTIFHGLALHGALWSAQTCCLEPLPPPAATAELSPSLNYVCVAPIGREQLNMKDLSWNVIRCPVFVASAEGSVASLHFTLPMWMSKDLEACTTLPEGQSGIYFQCTLPL